MAVTYNRLASMGQPNRAVKEGRVRKSPRSARGYKSVTTVVWQSGYPAHKLVAVNRAKPGENVRGASRPGFFWQGALIVLPAILLGGAGFGSPRQDRLLAEREASEQGRLIASGSRAGPAPPRHLPSSPQSDLAALERWRELPSRPPGRAGSWPRPQSPGALSRPVHAQARRTTRRPSLRTPAPQPLERRRVARGPARGLGSVAQAPRRAATTSPPPSPPETASWPRLLRSVLPLSPATAWACSASNKANPQAPGSSSNKWPFNTRTSWPRRVDPLKQLTRSFNC